MHRALVYLCLLLCLAEKPAQAWGMIPHSDAQLVDRAPIIVVGHIKDGSLQFTNHYSSYLFHATLVVTLVLKGEMKTREIPIVMNYGILPVPARLKDKTNAVDDILKEYPRALSEKGPLLLFEDNPGEGCTLILDDIHQDAIWFLRPGKPYPASATTQTELGVWSFQDIQPLSKQQKLMGLIK